MIGAAGEEIVLQECRAALSALGRADLAVRARRVSLISDQLGYDIVAPSVAGGGWRIEVKTTRTSAVLAKIILTRNEARVGLKDEETAKEGAAAKEEQKTPSAAPAPDSGGARGSS